jgi:AcrR family transcriptional regulator
MTTPPQRKDAARNWQRILDVARRLVDEDTPLQLNEVARLAGVGVATVYRHFPTPEALLETVATPRFEALIARGEQALIDDVPWRALSGFLAHAIEAQVADASLSAVTATSDHALPHTGELKATLRTVAGRLLERARDDGAVRPDLTTDELIPLLCGVAYSANVRGGGTAFRVAAAHRYLGFLLTGLRA